jgi:hypothetical protein
LAPQFLSVYTCDEKELPFLKMDDPQDYQDLDYPNHVEILSSQERVKNRLLQEGPFSVVLFRQDFTQMEPIHIFSEITKTTESREGLAPIEHEDAKELLPEELKSADFGN